MCKTRERIANHIKNHPNDRAREISEATGLKLSTVYYHMNILRPTKIKKRRINLTCTETYDESWRPKRRRPRKSVDSNWARCVDSTRRNRSANRTTRREMTLAEAETIGVKGISVLDRGRAGVNSTSLQFDLAGINFSNFGLDNVGLAKCVPNVGGATRDTVRHALCGLGHHDSRHTHLVHENEEERTH